MISDRGYTLVAAPKLFCNTMLWSKNIGVSTINDIGIYLLQFKKMSVGSERNRPHEHLEKDIPTPNQAKNEIKVASKKKI